jgi:LysM repeat protein
MFNPASFTMQHRNVFQGGSGLGSSGQSLHYKYTESRDIRLALIIDGTGVTEIGLLNIFGKTKSVSDRVKDFLKLCLDRDGKLHEPKFLRLNWGKGPLQKFDTRLISVDIEYTTFAQDGSPLRAVLNTRFTEDIDPKKRVAEERSSSPDLTHTRIVRSGDTLPLLSREIYGSAKYYLQLAKVNNLNDFRNLTPGVELIFPPLQK